MLRRKKKQADSTAPLDETIPVKTSPDSKEISASTEPVAEQVITDKPGKLPLKTRVHTGLVALYPKNIKGTIKRHPRRTMAVGIALLAVIILFALPSTRYKILGLVIKKPVQVRVINATSKLAVSEATVTISGKEAKTDANGVARFSAVPVGNHTAIIKKTYYKDGSVPVSVGLGKTKLTTATLTATGQPVSVLILNTISKKPVGNATITIGKEKYKTKDDGKAQVLLASDTTESKATISGDGFNQTDITITAITATKADAKNTFNLAPTGKIYFLSKRTGKIDVMKSNLDGTNQEVVLAGTGNESETDTILLASRDWKYLALKAKRDTKENYAALYVINTADKDKLITADEGNAGFTLAGWQNSTLVYSINRNDMDSGQSGKFKIKSYDAVAQKLSTIEQNTSDGSIYESFGTVYLTDKAVVYGKNWWCVTNYCIGTGKRMGLYTASADGSNKKTIQDFDAVGSNLGYTPYDVNEFYVQVNINNGNYHSDYYEYDADAGASLKQISITSDTYYKTYPSPVISPAGSQTAWTEQRDGKTVVLVGNKNGDEEKPAASLNEAWTVYGWYTNDYLLVAKKSSELYALYIGGGEPVKITDYHKPAYNFYGYGGGYGGF